MPTYSAEEIKTMCKSMDLDVETARILKDIIEEDLDLYNSEELFIIWQASMFLATRSMLMGPIKFMK